MNMKKKIIDWIDDTAFCLIHGIIFGILMFIPIAYLIAQ